MKKIDFCMMITQDSRNAFHSRPMSNNREVEYDGDSWFFTYEQSNKVKQIKQNPNVSLILQTDKMLFIECYGKATVIKQRRLMEEKWIDELAQWFPKGLDTPGICMLKVKASRIHLWDKGDEAEYKS